MPQKSILVVIPHFGADEHLLRSLKSLGVPFLDPALLQERRFALPFAYGEVCVVNNNVGENRGFTAASNEGIRYGYKKNFDAYWLLNNDTEVCDLSSAVAAFSKELAEHPETGVIGCKMLSMQDPDFIHHGGTIAAMPSGLHKTGAVKYENLNRRTLERWVTGASMIIADECVRETGLLDEQLFNYASDSDYCYRARLAGYRVVYLPVPILHAIGQSAAPSVTQRAVLEKDVNYFMNKWMKGGVFTYLDTETFAD